MAISSSVCWRMKYLEPIRNLSSSREFVHQLLRFFQIERIETLSEPTVDRSEKLAGLLPLALIAPEPAPCSSPHAAPRILLAVDARP
jgi:hypothetical protein